MVKHKSFLDQRQLKADQIQIWYDKCTVCFQKKSQCQWHSQGRAWQGLRSPATEIEEDWDTLVEKSNIPIKQSTAQVMPCQPTESGYATAVILHNNVFFLLIMDATNS